MDKVGDRDPILVLLDVLASMADFHHEDELGGAYFDLYQAAGLTFLDEDDEKGISDFLSRRGAIYEALHYLGEISPHDRRAMECLLDLVRAQLSENDSSN